MEKRNTSRPIDRSIDRGKSALGQAGETPNNFQKTNETLLSRYMHDVQNIFEKPSFLREGQPATAVSAVAATTQHPDSFYRVYSPPPPPAGSSILSTTDAAAGDYLTAAVEAAFALLTPSRPPPPLPGWP